jgi:hypothetical protein
MQYNEITTKQKSAKPTLEGFDGDERSLQFWDNESYDDDGLISLSNSTLKNERGTNQENNGRGNTNSPQKEC